MEVLRPSASNRWLKCTASPGLIVRGIADGKIPEKSKSTVYTEEGTLAHAWGKKALRAGDGFDYSQIVNKDLTENLEMQGVVWGYVSRVLGHLRNFDDTIFVESKLPLFYQPEHTGTVDAVVIRPDKIFVDDLKYGAGHFVEAEKNSQLTIYSGNVVKFLYDSGYSLDLDTPMDVAIYQPRCARSIGDSPERVWETNVEEVLSECSKIETVAKGIIADPDGGVFTPDLGGCCHWCPAKGICTARAEKMSGEFVELFENPVVDIVPVKNPSFPSPEFLTVEQISRLIEAKASITAWLGSVEEYGYKLLGGGKELPGFKLVDSYKHRAWVSEDKAQRFLSNYFKKGEFYTKKIFSPNAAEKLLRSANISSRGKTRLTKLIITPSGGPKLVPENDSRMSIQDLITSEFSDISEPTKNNDIL